MTTIETLVLASRNDHKLAELRMFLSGLPVTVKGLHDFPHISAIEEDGSSFEENALKKAMEVHRLTNLPALADDSGLEVFYLNGRPGIFSARYAGSGATDELNNQKLMHDMKGVAPRRRGARFVAYLALVAQGIKETAVGECLGQLGEVPRGTNGFGYDPLFMPMGFQRTYAELTQEEKNRISHRSNAFIRMKDILARYIR
jgi:XTP/dITP diphosphohydrolase